jgi:hypothetical protein
MNELVERLSKQDYPVEANRGNKTFKALEERVNLGHVHILFKDFGTELGIKLYPAKCDFSQCDFEKGIGKAHLEGGITLNYVKVKCIADIDLADLEGKGRLEPVSDEEYNIIMQKQ